MKKLPTISGRATVRIWLIVWALFFAWSGMAPYIAPHTGAIADVAAGLSLACFWAGTALTIIVLWLYYRGKVTDSKFNPRWLPYTCIGAWAAYLALIGSGRFIPFSEPFMYAMTMSIQVGSLLILPSIAVLLLGIGRPATPKKVQKQFNPAILRTVGSLIIAALVIGTYAAIRTEWTPIEEGKFVYNNTANGLGFAALALTVLLSYLQRDIYWLSRNKSLKLDERQIQERQQVFETSYKICAILVFAAFCVILTYRSSLIAVVQHDNTTPGNMLWPFANLVTALFALPLLVATYRKHTAKMH